MFRLAEDSTYVETYQGFDLTLALMDFGAGGGCGMYMREPVDLNAIGGYGSSQGKRVLNRFFFCSASTSRRI
jgi:hypothetical protein